MIPSSIILGGITHRSRTMIETLSVYIEQLFSVKSYIDLYVLFILLTFFVFLILALFLITDFTKKVLFLAIFLVLFFSTIFLGYMLPGTAKNIKDMEKFLSFSNILNIFGISVKNEREYEYLYHYVSREDGKVYFLMKNLENNVPLFLSSDIDEKKIKELENLLSQIRSKSRKDQNTDESVKIKMYTTEGFIKSFEMKFEKYDIKTQIPNIRKEVE